MLRRFIRAEAVFDISFFNLGSSLLLRFICGKALCSDAIRWKVVFFLHALCSLESSMCDATCAGTSLFQAVIGGKAVLGEDIQFGEFDALTLYVRGNRYSEIL